jgi:hypothetical protein
MHISFPVHECVWSKWSKVVEESKDAHSGVGFGGAAWSRVRSCSGAADDGYDAHVGEGSTGRLACGMAGGRRVTRAQVWWGR